jgi:hypothetical protein
MQQESLPQSDPVSSRPQTGKRRLAAALLAVAGAAYLVCHATPIASTTLGFAQGVLRPSMPSALAPVVEPPSRSPVAFMQLFGGAKKPAAKKPAPKKKPVAKKPVAKKPAPKKKPVAKKPVPKKKTAGGDKKTGNPLLDGAAEILGDFFFKPRDEMGENMRNNRKR